MAAKPYREALRQFKRDYWAALMDECGDQVSVVAKQAGVDRCHLYKVLKRIGFEFRYGNEEWRQLKS